MSDDIRAWLEETADRQMRDSTCTIVIPPGVQELQWAYDTQPDGPIDWTAAVLPSPITFIAVLENGDTIETTREPVARRNPMNPPVETTFGIPLSPLKFFPLD